MLLIYGWTISKVVRWGGGGGGWGRKAKYPKNILAGKILRKKIHASQVAQKNRLYWLKEDSGKTNVTEKRFTERDVPHLLHDVSNGPSLKRQ